MTAESSWQAPEGYQVIPVEEWRRGQAWWPLGQDLADCTPWVHAPRARTHVLVRVEPPKAQTERVNWWEAKGRRLPDGIVVDGVRDLVNAPQVFTCRDGFDCWETTPLDDDGTVEVLVETPAPQPAPVDDGPPRVGDTVEMCRWVGETGEVHDYDTRAGVVVALDGQAACVRTRLGYLWLAYLSDCTVTKRAES